MSKAANFLKECRTFYLATVEGDQPRVRPFGAVHEYNEKIYFCTNNTKNVFKQLTVNPKAEISATAADGRWIRITGDLIADPDEGARAAMLEANPMLKSMYSLGDGIFEVLYLKNASAVISSFSAAPDSFDL